MRGDAGAAVLDEEEEEEREEVEDEEDEVEDVKGKDPANMPPRVSNWGLASATTFALASHGSFIFLSKATIA